MPPIDDRTPKLDLPLPAQPNTLKNDVQRLRDTITKLDDKVVTIDPTTGKMDSSFLPDKVAILVPPHATLDPAMLPAEVVTVDATGKIPEDKIPDDARTNIHDVASEVLMLELDASLGDIARVTGSGKTYMLMGKTQGLTAPQKTDRGDWKEQVTTAVATVNGRTGTVTVAEPGVNADITNLTALSGPLTLGGDGMTDGDAVTMRQLKGAMGTSGGASMTGVMNNFIGAVEWHNGPSTALPAGHHLANGQILNRADVPDIVAAMKNGMLNVAPASGGKTSDQIWLNSGDAVRPYAWRSSYSWGDGDANTGTTIRLPDLNGAGLNSIKHLFLSGSSGAPSEPSAGQIWMQSAPNIEGIFGGLTGSQFQNGTRGAVNGTGPDPSYNMKSGSVDGLPGFAPNNYGFRFNANFSNVTYGRGSQYQKSDGTIPAVAGDTNNIGDLYPNHAVGYWIIRTNGAFVSANSKFEVINAYNPLPTSGAITGGFIQGSLNDDQGKTVNAVGVTVVNTIGGKPQAQFGVGNWDSADKELKWKHMDLSAADGSLTVPGAVWATPMPAAQSVSELGQLGVRAATQPNSIYIHSQIGGTGTVVNRLKGEWYTACYELFAVRTDTSHLQYTSWRFTPFSGQASNYFEITIDAGGMVSMPGGQKFAHDGTAHFPGNISAVTSTWPSDRDLKDDIEPIADALDKIDQLNGYSFTFKNTGMKSAGIIAQELAQAMPDLVSTNPDGHLAVQYNGVIGLLVAAVKELKAQNEDLQAQIDALKP
ncbi:tail fiber domain-containing protein [Salmonella enterica subsp. enterica serovar Enteritidis]|nr:tail fiber domain-containing protein [Salmonella enterica subsp. enterica serovar Enteritidis]